MRLIEHVLLVLRPSKKFFSKTFRLSNAVPLDFHLLSTFIRILSIQRCFAQPVILRIFDVTYFYAHDTNHFIGRLPFTYLNKIRTMFHQFIKRVASVDISRYFTSRDKQIKRQSPIVCVYFVCVSGCVCMRVPKNVLYIVLRTFAVTLLRLTLSVR